MPRSSTAVPSSSTASTGPGWRYVIALYGVVGVALLVASIKGDVERFVLGGLLVLLVPGLIVARIRRAAIEAEMQARREFLAGMSHDLRTPLNSVIGFSSVLLRTAPAKLSAQEIEYLERVRANGVQLLAVVDDLLARAARTSGETRAQPDAPTSEPAVGASTPERP